MLKTEENYVTKLESGLRTYAEPLDDLLQDRYNEEFYDIERLLNFHQKEFLPSLRENHTNVFDIANIFHRYITKDYFFDYIFYAMRKPKVEAFIVEHNELFDELGSNDKLGINSFLHEPIQRLPRYKLLFAEIIKVPVLIFTYHCYFRCIGAILSSFIDDLYEVVVLYLLGYICGRR